MPSSAYPPTKSVLPTNNNTKKVTPLNDLLSPSPHPSSLPSPLPNNNKAQSPESSPRPLPPDILKQQKGGDPFARGSLNKLNLPFTHIFVNEFDSPRHDEVQHSQTDVNILAGKQKPFAPIGTEEHKSSKTYVLDSRLIITQSILRLKERLYHEESYKNLFQFLVFLFFYMLVLYFQTGGTSVNSRSLRGVLTEALFTPASASVGDSSTWPGVDQYKYSTDFNSDVFKYNGELSSQSELTNVPSYINKDLFLRWLTYEILNPLYPDDVDADTSEGTQLTPGNYVVVGVKLTQTRADVEDVDTCSSSTFFELSVCEATLDSRDEYSFDPTFDPTSSIYNDASVATSSINPDYDLPFGYFYASQLSQDKNGPTTLPIAFGYRADPPVANFPIIFDRRLSRERVGKMVRYLAESSFVDDRTTAVQASIITYSPKLDLFAHIQVISTFDSAVNRWLLEQTLDIIDAKKYDFKDNEDRWRMGLEFLYTLALASLILRELHELRDGILQYGLVAGVLLYATNFGNIVDCVNYGLQIIGIISWTLFSMLINGWDPKIEYELYSNYTSLNNYLEGGDGLREGLRVFESMNEFSTARRIHSTLASFSLVVTCVQLVKNLSFHPRMGSVTRTISHAASEIFFFFLLFFSVVMIFSFFATMQYGNYLDEFSNLFRSANNLCIFLVGEFENLRNLMTEVDAAITNFFFWTFYTLCYFILLNSFLAIIVQAFEETKKSFDDISFKENVWDLILKHFLWKWYIPPGGSYHIDDKPLIDALEYILGTWSDPADPPSLIKDLQDEKEFPWTNTKLEDMKQSTYAMILRVQEGDTETDGTLTVNGERVFFGELDLAYALNTIEGDRRMKDMKFCRVLAYNVVESFGINADIDDDGVITNAEILSMKAKARHTNEVGTGFASVAMAARAQSASSTIIGRHFWEESAHVVGDSVAGVAGGVGTLFKAIRDRSASMSVEAAGEIDGGAKSTIPGGFNRGLKHSGSPKNALVPAALGVVAEDGEKRRPTQPGALSLAGAAGAGNITVPAPLLLGGREGKEVESRRPSASPMSDTEQRPGIMEIISFHSGQQL